jgi:hydroxymethylpyrimidine/phosphomethylpyrimidine kinase
VLTIAGSDSGGGAGIQADLKTIEAGGGFGTSAITSVTAQHTRSVEGTHLVPRDDVAAQIDAVTGDFDVRAVKTGMLATREIVDLITDRASEFPNLVVDPVMVATSGDRLLAREAERAYEALLPETRLVTPNADEAAVLTDVEPTDEASAQAAGEQLVELGADAALVKGGHVESDDVFDVLVTTETVETFRHPRVESTATHGSGCTLSSAIATRLAHGDDLTDAVAIGIELLSRAVRYPLDVGQGPGSVHHVVEARDDAARVGTAEAVESIVDWLVTENLRALVPQAGASVVGATPYAEVPAETAVVEGRVARTRAGLRPNRGVRFDVDDPVCDLLLAVREYDGRTRFALTCRRDDAVEDALAALPGRVATLDGETLAADVGRAMADGDETPVALLDDGLVRTDPTIVLLGREEATLSERAVELAAKLLEKER